MCGGVHPPGLKIEAHGFRNPLAEGRLLFFGEACVAQITEWTHGRLGRRNRIQQRHQPFLQSCKQRVVVGYRHTGFVFVEQHIVRGRGNTQMRNFLMGHVDELRECWLEGRKIRSRSRLLPSNQRV